METRRSHWTVLATASLAALSIAQNAPPAGAVEGTVINSVTGSGIAGASVILSANPSTRYGTTSDATGYFKFTGIAPGSYRAIAELQGFAAPQPDFRSLSNSGLRIASSPDPVKLELKLTPLSTVRGRVFHPEGTPGPGLEVNLNPNVLGSVVTDKDGRFMLDDVRPGSYTLTARPPTTARPAQTRDGARTAMVTTYYPSVADPSLAQPIVLGGQAENGSFEIRMQTAPVRRLRGIVQDEEGKPSPGAGLMLYPVAEGAPAPMGLSARAGAPSFFALGLRRAPTGTPETAVYAGKDGQFEFPAVPPGDWRINAESDPADGRRSSRGTASVVVSRDDIDDLQIQLATPFKLTGTIEWKDAAQPASNPERLFGLVTLVNADRGEYAGGGMAESGRLSFENLLPGRYQAIVKPGVAQQVFVDESEVTGQTFALAAGSRLRVTLRQWSGTVRGTVEKCGGARVVLVPQRAGGVALAQTVACDAGGSFEMNEVSPGDYYIAAFEPVDIFAPSPAVLSLVPSRGKTLKVEERSAANVTLTVIVR